MTREEEINFVASKYIEDNSLGGEVRISSHKDSFIEGAEWADANPESPWISVEDDLPNNPKYLKQPDYSPWVIAVTENGEVLPAQMIVMHEKWIWHSRFCRKHEDIVLWMPIPKFEEYLL